MTFEPGKIERSKAAAIALADARTPTDIAAAADLMRAFVRWQHVRHSDHRQRLDAYFNPEKFEDELARLPGPYSRPVGRLLLAKVGGKPAGCIALKPLGERGCEMKRLYVDPEYQGLGIGRLLATRLVEEAEALGYERMLLETGPLQKEAIGLYSAIGFSRIRPYHSLPDCLRDWLVCMERPLGCAVVA